MLLTVDIGTSVFKSALWDFKGNRLSLHKIPLPAGDSDGLRHETDSGQWIKAFYDGCAFLSASFSMEGVQALVLCGNGPSLVPVLSKEDHGALSYVEKSLQAKVSSINTAMPANVLPARLWLDRRATAAAARVSGLAGGFVDASFFLPKALHIKIEEPWLYEKTELFLGCPEFLAYALTGQAKTVFPAEGLERWFWTPEILEKLELDTGKFPPFIRPGEIFGGLDSGIAADLGLKPGIPVISGGSDFIASIIGTGVISPGMACNRTGTSDGINVCTQNALDGGSRLMCYRHPVKPFWNVSGTVSTTGKAIEWAAGILDCKSYEDFFSLAQAAKPGSGGVVFSPNLAGERAAKDPAKGAFCGLSLSAGRPELARSVLEGINFAVRDIIQNMEKAGAHIEQMHVCGSLAASDFLNQIKADITGKTVVAPAQMESELLGLAAIGLCTLGKYSSFAQAAKELVPEGKTFVRNNDYA